MGAVRRSLPEKDSVLSLPASGEARHHRLGAGELSVRRERRRRGREIKIRSLLYQALLVNARRDDCFEDDLHNVIRQMTITSCDVGFRRSEVGGGVRRCCPGIDATSVTI